MRSEMVEIYSDQTNAAVLRHPGRRFPGVLIQGDNLHALCRQADELCSRLDKTSPAFSEANALRNTLWSHLQHYRAVLDDHGIALPFAG